MPADSPPGLLSGDGPSQSAVASSPPSTLVVENPPATSEEGGGEAELADSVSPASPDVDGRNAAGMGGAEQRRSTRADWESVGVLGLKPTPETEPALLDSNADGEPNASGTTARSPGSVDTAATSGSPGSGADRILEWNPSEMSVETVSSGQQPDEPPPDDPDRGVILPWRPDVMSEPAEATATPPATIRRRRASRVYYGWVVTVAAAIGFGVSAGIGNWGFGAFVRPLEAEFGWSRGEVSAAASIGMAAILLGSLPVGWWVDRFGARSAIAFGAVGTAIGFMAMSQVQTLWQFYAIFGVTAFFRTFTTYIPLIAIVGLWFPGSSGRAMGLIMAGLGMGGVVFAPIATGLIEGFGWREAYVILGVIMAGYFLPASLLVMRSPRRAAISGATADATRLDGWAFGEALRSPAFWLLNVGIGFMWVGQVGFISHAQPLFEWRGYSPETAAAFVSLAALCVTLTRLVAGWLYVRLRRPALFALVVSVVAAAGLANLLPPVSQITLVAFFALWGLGSGAMVLLPPTLTADTYGQRSLGKLLAFTEVVGGFGSVGGPILGGVLFDSTGSYATPFFVYVLSTLVAGLALVIFVRVHRPATGAVAREVKAVAVGEPG